MDFRAFHLAICVCFCSVYFVLPASARPLDRLEKSAVEDRLKEMLHQSLKLEVKESLVDRDNDCWFSTADIPVMDPNSNKTRSVRVYLSRPVTRKPTPAVLVVPTIQGRTILESRIAGSLCENGIAAIIADVNNPDQPLTPPGWGLEDENFKFAIHSLRTVIDFAQSHPQIDKEKIGVIGGSLGGITAGLLAGVDDRIKAVVIAAAGGNLPAILTYSKYRKVRGWREKRMRYLGISDLSEYEGLLREKLRHDPLYFVDRIDSSKMLMFLVNGDDTVPEENQIEYWQGANQPQAVWLRSNHLTSLVRFAYLMTDDISAFFISRFIDP